MKPPVAFPFKFPAVPLALGLLLTLKAPVKADDQPPTNPQLKGQLVLKSMPLSPILGRKITTWVYLPPGYDDPMNASRRYPVIYLLHGEPGGWTDCYRSGHVDTMADNLITSGQIQPVIMVAFDGNGPRGARDMTNFCNRATDGYRVEDFIADELVPYVDHTYRTEASPETRALWGYSAGGYGALNLGFHHPDLWRVLCSHAGFYAPDEDAEVMTKALGPQGPLWDTNNPMLTVKKLPADVHLHVYMDASPAEDGFDQFQILTSELQARGDDVNVEVLKKAHAWKLIVDRCRTSLLFADKSFSAASALNVQQAGSTGATPVQRRL